jgi:phage tail sheath protein FI
VGYIDSITGEFKPVSLYQGLRDVLSQSTVQINPIATLPGSGITVMGQYTRAANSTALNRVNVARLVNYIRRQLSTLSKPFLFEPNDTQTRNEIKRVIEGLMQELVAQRGLYDYVVVCDTSNNTPTRIDQNQLWVDIAIEPVKAVEFIYIPLRLLSTGAIGKGNYGATSQGSPSSAVG